MKVDLQLSGKALAAGARLFLGVLLAFSSVLAQGGGAGPVNAASIAEVIVAEADHVTPEEMAQWLIEERDDYQLVDIRSPWQYDDYHIPTAINIPLQVLFEADGIQRLSRGKKVVVYGLGAGHSAQAQMLLAMKGFDAYSVRAGISAWWAEIMTPLSLWDEDMDPAGYQRARQIRMQFMGGPAGEAAKTEAAAPVAPPPPAAGKKPARRNKLNLGRGCS